MTLATPCDACGSPLHRDVVALRFTTLSVVPGGGAQAKAPPGARRAYLVCVRCAAYVEACIEVLEGGADAGPATAREAAS